MRQSLELADHLVSERVVPKPFRVYSSPFYRCLQTIQPGVEALKRKRGSSESGIDEGAVLDVRVENGVGLVFIRPLFVEDEYRKRSKANT